MRRGLAWAQGQPSLPPFVSPMEGHEITCVLIPEVLVKWPT